MKRDTTKEATTHILTQGDNPSISEPIPLIKYGAGLTGGEGSPSTVAGGEKPPSL